MTISTTDAFVEYVGDGVTVDFPFDFPAFEENWMRGFVDRVEQSGSTVLNADQNENPGGVFTFADAPAVDTAVVVLRLADFLQLTDYPPFTRFPARDHEEALDKLTMITQQLAYAIALIELDADLYVQKAGDIMEGALEVLAPTGPNDAVARDWVTAITDALEANKAERAVSILSDDTNHLQITDPTLADDVTIAARVNLPSGLAEITAAGVLPPEILPPVTGGIFNIIGLFDADPGTLPPDEDESGNAYIIVNPGTLDLFTYDSPGATVPTAVNLSDIIFWLEADTGFNEGWWYAPISLIPVFATNVLCDDALWPITAGQVQEAFDELFNTYLGTAAPLDAQVGVGDTTAGRLLRVGGFGVGDVGISIPGNDLDAIAATGFYNVVAGAANIPPGAAIGGSNVIHTNGSANEAKQIYQNAGTDGRTWVRAKGGGVWGSWFEIILEGSDAQLNSLEVPEHIDFVNSSTPALHTRISGSNGVDRQRMLIHGDDDFTLGGTIFIHGPDDNTLPGTIDLRFDNVPYLRTDALGLRVINADGELQRAGWQPGIITANSNRNFLVSDIGQTVRISSSSTLVIPAGLGQEGDMIQVIAYSDAQIITGGGSTLEWLQGGSSVIGARNIAQRSAVTLLKSHLADDWYIYGNGIT